MLIFVCRVTRVYTYTSEGAALHSKRQRVSRSAYGSVGMWNHFRHEWSRIWSRKL